MEEQSPDGGEKAAWRMAAGAGGTCIPPLGQPDGVEVTMGGLLCCLAIWLLGAFSIDQGRGDTAGGLSQLVNSRREDLSGLI